MTTFRILNHEETAHLMLKNDRNFSKISPKKRNEYPFNSLNTIYALFIIYEMEILTCCYAF